MKRREFLKTSAIIGGSASLGNTFVPNSGNENTPTFILERDLDKKNLEKLENDNLKVKIYSDGSVEIWDKKNYVKWETSTVAIQEYGPIEEGHVWLINDRSMVQQYPGRFIGKKINKDIYEFIVYGKQKMVRGKFICKITLDKEWLKYTIMDIDEELQSLMFPPPIISESTVIPNGIGRWNRNKKESGIYTRHIKTFWTHLNMRWIGGLKKDAGWLCVYEDGFQDACSLEANNTVTPGYMKTLDKWSHEFVVKFKFVSGNYVALAKAYREYFKKQGLLKTLDEKIQENPNLDKIKGGRGFWMTLGSGIPRVQDLENNLMFDKLKKVKESNERLKVRITYKEAKKLIDKYEKLGMKKGFIKIAGWINKGYDWSHPDIWPPDPELGSIEELKELMEREGDILTGLHDNYMDIYEGLPSFPNGVVRQRDGSLMTGGFWGGGQAYIMHYKNSLEYAKRNWKKIKTLNPKSMFCDTVTAMQMYQSFEKGKKLTKEDDYLAKMEFMKYYKDQNQVFGSEEVADFSVPYVDWYETRFKRDERNYIPLWSLVFNDAAFIMRYGSSGVGGNYPKWLEDMLWGTNLHFYAHKKLDEEYFKSTFHVDEWNAKVGTSEMINHKFLTEDNKVEQTEFSSGYSIIVNFSNEDREVDGKVIQSKNYKILS